MQSAGYFVGGKRMFRATNCYAKGGTGRGELVVFKDQKM